MGSFSSTFQQAIEGSIDPDLNRISRRYFSHYDFEGAFKNVSQREIVMGEAKQFLEYNLRTQFTNQ